MEKGRAQNQSGLIQIKHWKLKYMPSIPMSICPNFKFSAVSDTHFRIWEGGRGKFNVCWLDNSGSEPFIQIYSIASLSIGERSC